MVISEWLCHHSFRKSSRRTHQSECQTRLYIPGSEHMGFDLGHLQIQGNEGRKKTSENTSDLRMFDALTLTSFGR